MIPWMNQLIILDDNKVWVVCTTTQKKQKNSVQLMSTLSMMRAAWKPNAQIYEAMIKEVGDDGRGTPIPPKISKLLKTYADRMLDEFLKVLLLSRVVNHHIEIEPSATPLVQSPYKLLGLDLDGLRRQFIELVDAGFIHPS